MAAPVFDPAQDALILGRTYIDRVPESALPRPAPGNAGTVSAASHGPAPHAPVEDRPVWNCPAGDGPVWDGPAWEALVDQVPEVDDEAWRSEPGWAEVERLEPAEVVTDLLFQIWITPGLVTLPQDPADAWIGVDRVPPRPLLGVTGCAGPGLATGLQQVDPRRLTPGQLVEVLTGAERLIRWAQGLQLSAAAGLAEYATITDPDHQDDPLFGGERAVEVGFSSPREIGEFCADGIGAALGTNHTAGRQLIQAGCMSAELPVVQELFAVGLLDLPRVKALLRELCRIPDLAADLDWVNQTIREHHLLTPRLLGNTVRKLIMERYPEQAEAGRKAAKQRRRISVEPCEDGMAMFKAFLSAEDALMAYRALTEAAWLDHDHRRQTGQQPSACDGEYVGIDALRADAFTQAMYDLHDATTNADNGAADSADNTDSTSDNNPGNNSPGAEASGDDRATGTEGADDERADDEATGDGTADDEATGDLAAGDGAAGNDPGEDDAPADRPFPDMMSGLARSTGDDLENREPGHRNEASSTGGDHEAKDDHEDIRAGTRDDASTAVHDHGVEDDLEADRPAQPSADPDPPATATSYQDQQGPTEAPGDDPPAPGRAIRRARKKLRRRNPAKSMLHVYMLGSTAAGLDNKPADLLGYGPITAEHARAITENADLMRLLLDPFTGDIRSIDTPAYRIPNVLRWAAQARDRTCTFPGCAVPADETEIDHMIPHPFARKLDKALAHGTTTLTNLTSLCKRHHRAKTHAGWIIEATESGDWLNWIAPTGHHYRRLVRWGPPKGFWTDHQDHLMRTSAGDPAPF